MPCKQVADTKRTSAADCLQPQEAHAQCMLAAGSENIQHEVDEVVVGSGMQEACRSIQSRQPVPRAWHDLEQLRRRVQEVEDLPRWVQQRCRKRMSFTIRGGEFLANDSTYLRSKKQQQRLAEVPEDASHTERHPCKVGESVPNKHLPMKQSCIRMR